MLGSGVSSESIWTAFDSVATATIRPITAKVLVAWTRTNSTANYATVGSSIVGGFDVIQGLDSAAINNADTFDYFDETDKVLKIEYERNLIEPLGGFSMALAHITLDNTDLRFTPNINATIGTAIRPNRPVKIFIGFEVLGQQKIIPIIEGLTLQPREDKLKRTVTFDIIDYLRWLNEKPQETAIYEDQRTDEIIADILSRAGVGTSNYRLDQGLNTVGFAWFEKGQTAGDRIKTLCEAEEAVFYQDELGVLHFENRDKYGQAPYNAQVWTIEPDDMLSWEVQANTKIINRAIVSGKPRTVKGEKEVWRDGVEEIIPAGGSLTIWANFDDPVASFTSPVSGTDYEAHALTGGLGTDLTSDISIVMTEFTTAAKLVISNASGSEAFLNLLKIRGLPATVDYEISEVFQDTVSIEDFNEQQVTIDNPYIDNKTFARNMARDIVRRYKNPSTVIRLTVRGMPHLQLRDQIRVKDMDLGTYKNYRLMGIQGNYESGGFTQKLTLREITVREAL